MGRLKLNLIYSAGNKQSTHFVRVIDHCKDLIEVGLIGLQHEV